MEVTSQARLGAAVRAARRRSGLTQRELAERAGMVRQSLVAVERGRGNPTWDTVLRLTEMLGMVISVDDKAGGVAVPSLQKRRRAAMPRSAIAVGGGGRAAGKAERMQVAGAGPPAKPQPRESPRTRKAAPRLGSAAPGKAPAAKSATDGKPSRRREVAAKTTAAAGKSAVDVGRLLDAHRDLR